MVIEGFMDTIRKASNFARKHVNNTINTYKYLTGERDSRYDYTAKASEADIKKTAFGQKTSSSAGTEYKVKDKETGKIITKKLGSGRPLYKDFEKLGVKYEAKKDPNNNMVRIRFRSDEVPVAVARLLDPKYPDGAKLRQYMTDFTGGYVVLEFPMDDGKNSNKNKTKDQNRRNPDSGDTDQNRRNPDSGDTNESMMTPVQVPLRGRTLQCDKDGHIIVRESYDTKNLYKELKSKLVVDADGFMTDYTMYYDIENGQYIFIFGDRDIYTPDNSDTDFECETREEAEEWFDDYEGPGFEDWYNEDDEEDLMDGDLEDQFHGLLGDNSDEEDNEEDWESRTDRFDDIESPYYNGDLEDSDFEEESINYGGATSNIPASKPSSIDMIDKPRARRYNGLQLKVEEGEDGRYTVTAFYGLDSNGHPTGVAESDNVVNWDQVEDLAHDFLSQGHTVTIKDNITGKSVDLDYDSYFDQFEGEFPVKPEDLETTSNNESLELRTTEGIRQKEDYWFGGTGKVDEPDQSLKDNQPLELDLQDITKEDEDQDAEDATESLDDPEDEDPDESVGLKDPKDEKKSVTLNEDPIKSGLKITLDNGKVYEYAICPTIKKDPEMSPLSFVKENLHMINEDANQDDEDRPLRVCDRCLMGIESHEGKQFTRKIYFDDDDEDGEPDGVCDWCGESGFDELNEVMGSLDESVK